MGFVPPLAKKLPLRLTSAGPPGAGAQKYGVGAGGVLSQLGFAAVVPGVLITALTTESKDKPSIPDTLDGLNNACQADVPTSLPVGRFPANLSRSLLIVKFALTIFSTAVTSSSSGFALFGLLTQTRQAFLFIYAEGSSGYVPV